MYIYKFVSTGRRGSESETRLLLCWYYSCEERKGVVFFSQLSTLSKASGIMCSQLGTLESFYLSRQPYNSRKILLLQLDLRFSVRAVAGRFLRRAGAGAGTAAIFHVDGMTFVLGDDVYRTGQQRETHVGVLLSCAESWRSHLPCGTTGRTLLVYA